MLYYHDGIAEKMTGYEQACLREVAKWLNEEPNRPAPTEAIATLCAVVLVLEHRLLRRDKWTDKMDLTDYERTLPVKERE